MLKVFVMSQSFREISFLHDPKRGAVNEAPFFVWTLRIERQRGLKLGLGLSDNFNFCSLLKAPHDLHRLLSKRLAERGVIVEKLG